MSLVQMKTWFAIAYPYDPQTAGELPQYVSQFALSTDPDDDPANVPFETVLEEGPRISEVLYEQGQLSGSSRIDVGSLSIINADQSLDFWRRLRWDGRRIVVGQIEPGQTFAAALAAALEFTMGQLSAGEHRHTITLRGRGYLLERAVQPKLYGPHGRVLELNAGGASTDWLVAPVETNPINLGEWTIEGWYRARAGTLPAAAAARNCAWALPGATAALYYGSRYGAELGGLRVNNAIWDEHHLCDGVARHVAVRYRNGTVWIVLNGQDVAEGSLSHDPSSVTPTAWPIGSATVAGSEWLEAAIGDVRVWSSALETSDIRARMNSRLSGLEQYLRSWFPINEGTDVLGTSDQFVFDETPVPLGSGAAQINGSPTWLETGEAISSSLVGRPKPLPVGRVPLLEPDLVDGFTDLIRISSEAHRSYRLIEGGRALVGDGAVDVSTSGGGLVIPSDSSTDFGSGDVRTAVIGFRLRSLSSAGKLLHASNGSVLWDWVIGTDGSISITMESNPPSGGVTLISPAGVLEAGGRYRVLVSLDYGGALRLVVNRQVVGSTTLPGTGHYNPGAIGIGQAVGGGSEIDAEIERFAFVDRFLPARDQEWSRNAKPLPESDSDMLIGYELNELTGATATDSGSAGVNATVTGSAWAEDQYEEVSNNPTDGTVVRLLRPASEGIRAEVEGWLPLGRCVASAGTVSYDSSLQVTGDFAVGAWVQWLDGLNNMYFDRLTTGTTVGEFFFRQRGLGGLQARVESSAGTNNVVTSNPPLLAGEWFHAIMEWIDGVEMRFYVNGALWWSAAVSGTIAGHSYTGDLGIWQRDEPGMQAAWMLGRALTPSEIRSVVHQTRPFRADGDLVGCWPMDEESGTTAYDYGPNELHATGFASVRAPGVEPRTATEISKWLALRDSEVLDVGDVDEDSTVEFEAKAASAAVGKVFRDESQRQAVDALVAPLGFHRFEPLSGKWTFGQFWLPDMRLCVDFDGSTVLTVPDDPAIRLLKTSDIGAAFWVYIAQWQPVDVLLANKPGALSIYLDWTGSATLLRAFWVGDDGVAGARTVAELATELDEDSDVGRWMFVEISRNAIRIDGQARALGSLPPLGYVHPGGFADLELGDGLIGSMLGFSLYTSDPFQRSETPHLHLVGDENGVAGYWPLDDAAAAIAEDRAAGGNSGTWDSTPTRLVKVSPITGDRASEELSRHTWQEEGGLKPRSVAPPTLRERVSYRARERPYDLDDLVGVAKENNAGVSERVRPHDVATASTGRDSEEHRTAVEGDLVPTSLQDLADAQRAVDLRADVFGRQLEAFEVSDLVPHWGAVGRPIRLNADLEDGSTRYEQPLNGKDFLVVTARFDPSRTRHILTLLGVAPS